jgi:hypothetical protein
MCYIYTVEYYSVIRKNEDLPFTTAWMELEIIMLSEINQAQKDSIGNRGWREWEKSD